MKQFDLPSSVNAINRRKLFSRSWVCFDKTRCRQRTMALALLVQSAFLANGQIIYEATFSGYPDGTTIGTNWHTDGTDCDDASLNEGLGISAFGVYGGRFTANDSEGAPCCPQGGGGRMNYIYTDTINIEGYCRIWVEIQAEFLGTDDQCDGFTLVPYGGCVGTDPPDNVIDLLCVEYQFDSGPWLPLYSFCLGTGGTFTFTNYADAYPSTTMRARVSMGNNADSEYIYLDMLRVTAEPVPQAYFLPIGPFCDGDPIYNLPNVSANGYSGTWNIGTFFDPTGLAGTTTTLIFTADPIQCVIGDTLEVEVLSPLQLDIEPFGPFCSHDPVFTLQLNVNGYDGFWEGPGTDGWYFYPDLANIGTNTLTYQSFHCGEEVTVDVEVGNGGTVVLGQAAICESDDPIDLVDLEDPNFSSGTWTGPGVNANTFDPNGQYGNVILTFTPNDACVGPSTTTVTVNPNVQIVLGSTTLCTNAPQFDLSGLADPAHPSGTWSGPGVTGNNFDPSDQNGNISLHFEPTENCIQPANTIITVVPSETPILGTTSVCENSQPLDLGTLTDPSFQNGYWDGLGVSGNAFNPNGLDGPVVLNFTASANCVEPAMTTVIVNQAIVPQLETASLCESDVPLNLASIADPVFPNGTWTGPGVTGESFDPDGLNGLVQLSFLASANCAETATTSITINPQPSVASFTPDCDTTAQTYIISFDLTGGTPPYFIDGNPIAGNSFTSVPIPSGTGYAYAVDDQAGCGPVSVSGSISCGCAASSFQLNQMLCPAESITINGIQFNAANPSGTVVIPNGNFQGCDSVVTVALGFYPVAIGQVQENLCPGESLTVNGIVFNAANPTGAVVLSNGSFHGCDSLVNVSLSFWPAATGQLQQSLCTGGSLTINSTVFDESNPTGTVVIPNGSIHGCDSTVLVSLTFANAVNNNISPTVCAGESLNINGELFDQAHPAGIVMFPNGSYLGCDSIINVSLSFWAAASGVLAQTLCNGGSLTINNTVFDESNPTGTVVIPNGSIHGCDSTVQVNLTFTNAVNSNINPTLCPEASLAINGELFDQTNPIGTVLYSNGSYLGCDSIVNVSLSFWPMATGQLQESLCTGGSLTVNNTVFDEANPTGTVVIPNGSIHGCDSTVLVSLTFTNVVSSTVSPTLCQEESLTINGELFDQAHPTGTVLYPNGSYLGCDSIVNVSLSFWPVATGQVQESLCTGGSLMINNTVFDEATPTGTVVIPNGSIHGCDSTVLVSLTFTNVVSSTVSPTLCQEESLTINGELFDQAHPTGTVLYPNGSYLGCDSIVNVALSFWPMATGQLQESLCTGGSLTVNNTVFDEANPTGTVLIQNGSNHGCDSTVFVSLTFNNAVSSAISPTICPDNNLLVGGTLFDLSNPSGAVLFANGSYLGCDSTVFVNLSFLPLAMFSIDSVMQPGQSLLVNGSLYDQQSPAGTEIVLNGNWQGCDSIILINLVYPSVLTCSIRAYATSCFGEQDGYLVVDTIIGGLQPFTFSIENGPSSIIDDFPFSITGLSTGNYLLTVTSSSGQSTTTSVSIPSGPTLLLDLGPDLTLEFGTSMSLTANANFQPTNFEWVPNTYLDCTDCPSPFVVPLDDIAYTLTATSATGCQVSDELNIFIERNEDIYVPNAFSPNDDGINDVFTVFAGNSVANVKRLLIFDRWGDAVFVNHDFSPNDLQYGWDGSYRGKKADNAVFVWFAIVEFVDGTTKVLEGGVTLVR